MQNETENPKSEIDIQKLVKVFHPEIERFKDTACRYDAVMELIRKAQARKATATNEVYYTLFELENERKAKIAHWDAVISRLTNYLIGLTRKGRSMYNSVITTEIEDIKALYPHCYYDPFEDTIYVNEGNEQVPIAENASELIYDYFEGQTVETNEYDPADRSYVEVSGQAYVEMNYLGLDHAFNSI